MATAKEKTSRRISIQRAYEDPAPGDGYRVLADRYWPRGRSKEVLKLDEWARELAPTIALIRWFGHDPLRWTAFRRRYGEELAGPLRQQRMHLLLEAAAKRSITLVYGARSETENQAVVLREALLAIDRR